VGIESPSRLAGLMERIPSISTPTGRTENDPTQLVRDVIARAPVFEPLETCISKMGFLPNMIIHDDDKVRDLGKFEIESRLKFADRQITTAKKFLAASKGAFSNEHIALNKEHVANCQVWGQSAKQFLDDCDNLPFSVFTVKHKEEMADFNKIMDDYRVKLVVFNDKIKARVVSRN